MTSKTVKIDWNYTYVQENAHHAPIYARGWFFDEKTPKEFVLGILQRVVPGRAFEYRFITTDNRRWKYFMLDKVEEDPMKKKGVEINENTVFSCLTAQKARWFLGKTGQFSNSMDKPTFVSGKLAGIKTELRESMFVSEGQHHWKYFAPDVEPIYREFNVEDLNALVGKIIVEKFSGNRSLITGIHLDDKFGLYMAASGEHLYTTDILYLSYTMDDGSPCGVLS